MSKNNIQEKLDKILNRINKPARYIGGEPYTIIKENGSFDVRFAFCFPDTYEIGMSFMGLSLLYSILNKTKTTFMERVFAPDVDMEAANVDMSAAKNETETKKQEFLRIKSEHADKLAKQQQFMADMKRRMHNNRFGIR